MEEKTVVIILGLLLVSSFTGANPVQPDYTYYPTANGWLKLHTEPATWREARLVCATEDAVLASPVNAALEQAIREVLSQSQTTLKVFTGVHDTHAAGYYYSMEGTPLSSMPVHLAQEEAVKFNGTGSCLKLSKDGDKMTNGDCSEALPYMCFKRKTPVVLGDCGTDKDYKYEARTNGCYKFHTEAKTWSEAFATCSDEGAHLAVINSATEAQVFIELYAKANASVAEPLYEVTFVGFTDLGDHKTWMTIDGQTLQEAGYNKWAPDQPEDEDTRCGAMFGGDGLLDDYWCDDTVSFICELEPKSVKKEAN